MQDHALQIWQPSKTIMQKLHCKEIESSSQERDLEILIQEDFDWDAHVVKVTNQANHILEMIRRSYEDKSVKNIGSSISSFTTTVIICVTSFINLPLTLKIKKKL